MSIRLRNNGSQPNPVNGQDSAYMMLFIPEMLSMLLAVPKPGSQKISLYKKVKNRRSAVRKVI